MLANPFRFLAVAVFVLLVGLCATRPPAGRANGDKDKHEQKGGHAHVSMIARGKEIYTTRCAVCHGDAGDGKGPAGVALPLKPADFRDKAGVAEMRDNYWFWRVSEGGQVEPFKGRGSAMPPWKGQLSVEERWAVMAYQHTFSGHQGPHVPWEHPGSVAMGRDIYAMACVMCHGVDGKGDGSVGPMLSPRRAPQPRDFTAGVFKFRSTPSGELPITADLYRTVTEGIAGRGGPLTFGMRRHRIMPSFRQMPEEQRLEVSRPSTAGSGNARRSPASRSHLRRQRPRIGSLEAATCTSTPSASSVTGKVDAVTVRPRPRSRTTTSCRSRPPI